MTNSLDRHDRRAERDRDEAQTSGAEEPQDTPIARACSPFENEDT